MNAIERGDKSTLVISPTASGKTVTFIELATRLIPKMNDNEVIMVMSHLSLLTQQTKKKFNKFSSLPVGILQGQTMPSPDDRVVVSTVQSAKVFDKIVTYYEQSKKKVKYIIIDESHRSLNNNYKTALESFSDARLISFTATPFRGKRLATSTYDSIAFQISLGEMIDQKYLVPPVLKQIELEQDTPEKRCALMLKTYCEYEKGKKAIIFLRTKDECSMLVDALIREGVKAASVTDNVTGKKRDDIFDQYDGDGVDVLVSVEVLTMGFDSLLCEVVMMFGTQSPAVYMQRVGRALRPMDGLSVKPEHSKQTARIYCMGDLPTIESGVFEKHHNQAIRPKSYDDCKTLEEQVDYLEMNDMVETEEYKFNSAALKVQRLAKKINMEVLNGLINERSIPMEFMTKLANGVDNFKSVAGGDKTASRQQVEALKKIGVNPPSNLTSNEARLILQSLTGKAISHHASETFIIKSGKFAGSHISEVPWAFKSIILKRFPNSDIAKQIRSYHRTKS